MNTNLALDPKLSASGLGQAASTILWVLLLALIPDLRDALLSVGTDGIPDAAGTSIVAVLVGATGLLFSIPFGWWVKNAASPVEGDGASFAASIEERVAEVEGAPADVVLIDLSRLTPEAQQQARDLAARSEAA